MDLQEAVRRARDEFPSLTALMWIGRRQKARVYLETHIYNPDTRQGEDIEVVSVHTVTGKVTSTGRVPLQKGKKRSLLDDKN